MTIMWATRGKNWGFRFLADGAENDPLPTYRKAFENRELEREFIRTSPEFTAARIDDLLDRTDDFGRTIPHDFVLRGQFAEGINTLEDVREIIWPLVAQQYEDIWDQPINSD